LEQRLTQLRWSREDLAAQVGPSLSTVYKSLLGGRGPSERTLVRLEMALGWQRWPSHCILTGGAPSLSISHAVNTVSAQIDTELARGEQLGVTHTVTQFREFLLDVAHRLQQFYAGPDRPVGAALDARTA
jgi:hypothetical protein